MMQGQSGVQTLDKVVECFVFCVWNLNQVPLLSHNQMEKGELTYKAAMPILQKAQESFEHNKNNKKRTLMILAL